MPELQSPADRLGAFKALADVPESRRLHQHANAYEERDIWAEYRSEFDLSGRMKQDWDLFSRRWKEHMQDCGRHHALARPNDVEAWSEQLLSQVSVNWAYRHWNVIEGFYDWLKWHTEYSHSYNPFHMAAMDPESHTRTIWNRKMEKKYE